MVVVNGSWGKNATSYPIPINDDMVISTLSNKMSAKAVFIARPNSHPFQERTVILDDRVKVGRSVARSRALPTNAIFDCKVLSRHHAVLWYDSGKVYLQDTKSSNGTFVNNIKLCSSDTEAQEVCSGDIVQFGVNVLDNNHKITHNCIIATLKLYLPDGKEAKASPSITETPHKGVVSLDELYKLNQVIQEAIQREQCLEMKLTVLQRVVEATRKSTQQSWQVYIGEERLLSRISALEGQLTKASRNLTDETLREELTKLQEEKIAYQAAAKEALSKLHEESLEAVCLASERERMQISTEQEAILVKEQLAQALKELNEVAERLMSEQRKADEERTLASQTQHELQARLDTEIETSNQLRTKLEQVQVFLKDRMPREQLEKCNVICMDELISKKELLGENECENETHENGHAQQNHINLTVVSENSQLDSTLESQTSSATLVRDHTIVDNDVIENVYQNAITAIEEWTKVREDEKGEPTLKYQYQSIGVTKQLLELKRISQVHLQRSINLESELQEQKDLAIEKTNETIKLRRELQYMEEQLKENCNEMQQLRDRVEQLTIELNGIKDLEKIENISATCDNTEQIDVLEEELVTLKERFGLINDEKMQLNKDLVIVREQYDSLRNRSSNTIFFYIAPLVLMVFYLLISQYFS